MTVVCTESLSSVNSYLFSLLIEKVEKHLTEHRNFLKENYAKGVFIASGAKIPRTGGMIIASAKNKEEITKIIKQDPFHKHGVANYDIVEFLSSIYNKDFSKK